MDIIAWDQATDTAVEPERAPNEGEWARFTDGNRVTKRQFHSPSTPTPQKSIYTGPQFWKALDSAEQVLLINKSKTSDTAGAIFESIKLNGLDFNDPDDLTIGNQMVTAGILIQDRLDELVG